VSAAWGGREAYTVGSKALVERWTIWRYNPVKMISTCVVLLAAGLDLGPQVPIRPVCAYIDPGTGSLVLQILVGSVLASLVAIKLYWRQLKEFAGSLIRRRSGNVEAQDTEESGGETDRPEGRSDV
jgi:hypothetical protein